jgi:hypothetical protein
MFPEDDAHGPAKLSEIHLPHVGAVHEHAPARSVVEAGMRFTSVLLPEPVGPTMAMVCPGCAVKLTLCNAGREPGLLRQRGWSFGGDPVPFAHAGGCDGIGSESRALE